MFRTAPIDQGEHVEHGQKNGPKTDGGLSPHGQAHDAVGESSRKTHGERDDRQNHTPAALRQQTGAGDDADDRGRPSQEKARLMLVT